MTFRERIGFFSQALKKRCGLRKSGTRRFKRPIAVEECETRLVLTTTVFLDFGAAFAGGGLTVSDADMALATINGPNVFGAGHNLQSLDTQIQASAIDFDGNGSVDANDTTALITQVLASVQQSFQPFNVNVQLAQAASVPNIATSLAANGSTAGNRDVYVIIAGSAPAGLGGAFGASRTDVGNLDDNTSFVFANELISAFPDQLVIGLASMAAHEAGHALGLVHTKGSEPIVTGDIMSSPPYSADDFSSQNVFTRFDLPLDVGVGTQNAYDYLAAVVGLAPTGPTTITGTDAHDKITITRLSASTAQVTVEAFSNATKLPADSLGTNTYVVDTTLGLLVEAGAGDDLVTVDADIMRNIDIRGGAGSDAIQINGTGTFMPTGHFDHVTYFATAAGAGRVDFDGLFAFSFSELEPLTLNLVAGVLTISVNDGLGHIITLEDDGNTANNMSRVTIDGGLEDITFINPNALFLEANAGHDTITLTKLDPGMTGNVVINGGHGNDSLIVDSTTGLVTGLSSLLFDGGAGFDRVDITQTGGSQTSESVFIGALPGSGRHVLTGPGGTQTLDFQNIEPFTTNVIVATFNISSTPGIASLLNGNNAIDYSAGQIMGPTWGRVTVDNFEPIEFQNKTNLQISAGAGNDHVVLDNSSTPTGLKSITVNGEAGNDVIEAFNIGIVPDVAVIRPLKLTGGSGTDRLDASELVQTINVELLGDAAKDELLGGLGDDLYDGGAGDDLLVDSPGADNFIGGAGFDTILIQGTEDDDIILVDQTSTTGLTVTFNGASFANTFATVEAARIEAGDGDDLIGINVNDALITTGPPDIDNGSLAFRVKGGSPNASDRLIVRDDGTGDLVIHRQGADGRSGSVTVGPLKPVDYEGIEFVDITPLDTATGQTGTNFDGRLIVFRYDRYESNASRLVATPLGGQPVFLSDLSIDPGPTVLPPPFGSIGGDEDWFEFRADRTSVYRFDVLFRLIPTLASGRQGLPTNGDLDIQIYDESGTLIATQNNSTDNESIDVGIVAGNRYFLKVYGFNGAINAYQLNVTDIDQVGPQIYDPDGAGPLNGVHITDNPATAVNEANYNLFDPKPTIDGPTPLIHSLTINLRDHSNDIVGDLFGALDPNTASQPGLYQLVGDRNGRIAIASVVVTNNPIVPGEPATATIELRFFAPLPDDRYTLTILDSLSDFGGNKLDGESNAAEPQSTPLFPSGNNVSGGNFVARFTVDSRPEVGVYAGTTITTDINGNFKYDPQNTDYTNRDLTFQFGTVSDQRFAGKLGPVSAFGTYFDVLAAYGKVGGQFRFLIDVNGNGAFDAGESFVSPLQIDGLAVAGNFDGDVSNGDEIAIFSGTRWYLDVFGAQTVVNNGLRGYPIVGDFDGDGKVDLGTYQNNTFNFDLASNGYGQKDAVIQFGAPGVLDRAIAADMDGDGITDIGIWVPQSGTVNGDGEWRFLISNDFSVALRQTGTVVTLNHPFSTVPLGHDLAVQFGDYRALPIVGNFDPPTVPTTATARTTAPVTTVAKTTAPTTTVSKSTTSSTTKTQTPTVTTPAKSVVTAPAVVAKTTSLASTATTPVKLAASTTTTTKLTTVAEVSSAISSASKSTASSPVVTSVAKSVKTAPVVTATPLKAPVIVTSSKIATSTTTNKPVAKTTPVVTATSSPIVTSKKTTTAATEKALLNLVKTDASQVVKSVVAELTAAAQAITPKVVPVASVLQKATTNVSAVAAKPVAVQSKTVQTAIAKSTNTTALPKVTSTVHKLAETAKTSVRAITESLSKEACIDQVFAKSSAVVTQKTSEIKLPAEWVQRLVWISEQSAKQVNVSGVVKAAADLETCEAKTSHQSDGGDLTSLLPQAVDAVFSSQAN